MLTPEVVANYRCLNHEPENSSELVQLGVTRSGAPGRSSACGSLIDEAGHEPVPANADGGGVRRGCRRRGVRLCADNRACRQADEQWEHEQSSGESHEGLGSEESGWFATSTGRGTPLRGPTLLVIT